MKKLGIYIHIPFCKRKCHYCDFVSYADLESVFDEYVDAVIAETRLHDVYLKERTVDTVFIGGGTPSLLSPNQIGKLMIGLSENCNFAPREVTIEANPESLSEVKAAAYSQCYINRLSIGMQSHDDGVLKDIGRLHTYETFLDAYTNARLYIGNISIDTMFALPGQTIQGFEETLRRVIALDPQHISSYALKLEPGTLLERTFAGVDEDTDRDMYHLAVKMTKEAGYDHYETSNFSKQNAQCLHNLKYWTGGDYLGLGVAAHSYTTAGGKKQRFSNVESVSEYLLDISSGNLTTAENSIFSDIDEKLEYIMLRLRLKQGIDFSDYNKQFSADFQSEFAQPIEITKDLGLILENGGNIAPTLLGFDLQNTLIAKFMKKI